MNFYHMKFGKVFRALSLENRRTYRMLRDANSLGVNFTVLSEDTVTEILLFGIYKRIYKRGLPVVLYRLNRKQEHRYGSDFEIWFDFQRYKVYKGYRIQAKRVNKQGKFEINVNQSGVLIRSQQMGVPLYGIYYPQYTCSLLSLPQITWSWWCKFFNVMLDVARGCWLLPADEVLKASQCKGSNVLELWEFCGSPCSCGIPLEFIVLDAARQFRIYSPYQSPLDELLTKFFGDISLDSQLPPYIPAPTSTTNSSSSSVTNRSGSISGLAHTSTTGFWMPSADSKLMIVSSDPRSTTTSNESRIGAESLGGGGVDDGGGRGDDEQAPIDFPEIPRYALVISVDTAA